MATSPGFKNDLVLKQRLKDGTVDFDTDTIYAMLIKDTFDIIKARTDSTAYIKGDFYKNASNYYVCIVAGTSNATPPTFTTDLTTFTDGTADFQDIGTSQMDDGFIEIYSRVNSTVLTTGQYYIPTTPNGHYYECTATGTTDASEPTYKTDGTTFTDGTATIQDLGLYTNRPKFQIDSSFSVKTDITPHESSGTGYTAGGNTLTNPTVTNGLFDADDVTWTNATISALYLVLYRSGTVNSLEDPILMAFRLGETEISSTNADFSERWPNGILV